LPAIINDGIQGTHRGLYLNSNRRQHHDYKKSLKIPKV